MAKALTLSKNTKFRWLFTVRSVYSVRNMMLSSMMGLSTNVMLA